jgi:Lon protease-like protein
MDPEDLPDDPDELPTVIPVFPLSAPLLLPGTAVPLHLSDPGHRNLVEDALEAEGYIGIVLPTTAGIEEEAGEPGEADSPLYTVGCLGFIGELGEDQDARYLALVGGVIRFRVLRELPPERGYRRAVVDYQEFREDLDHMRQGLEFTQLKEVVRRHMTVDDEEVDPSIMDNMEGTEIVTAVAQALPFCAAERQALMETPDLRDLEQLLLQLMAGPGGDLRFDYSPHLPS